jgi:hypothetical protein
MPKLAGQLLTMRRVAAFWLLWSLAFVLMLWAVSPGRTLQDALAAELLQGHLAGGYQLRNPPLYEWLLWMVQQVVGPGPLSYLILRYSLIAATGILFYAALLRTVASPRLAAPFSLSLVLFFWFGWEIHHSVSHTLALLAASLALFNRSPRLCRAANGGTGASPRTHYRHRAHGQMELPARGAEPRRGARRDAGDAGVVSRASYAARARRCRAANPAFRAVARYYRSRPRRPPHHATRAGLVA